MTAAQVQFLTITGAPCPEDERPARFTFRCVGFNRTCNRRDLCARLLIAEGPHSASHGVKRDPQNQNGGRAQWDWDGNRDAPTFSPSIDCSNYCGWHGYIRAGNCVEA